MVMLVCFVGLLFVASGVAKLTSRQRFEDLASQYRLPFGRAGARAIRILPVAELMIGGAVLMSVGTPRALALVAALGVIGASTLAIAARASRGDRRIRCGCGMRLDEEMPVAHLLARNSLLIAVVALAFGASDQPLPTRAFDAALAWAGAVGGMVLIELLAATSRTRVWLGEWTASG